MQRTPTVTSHGIKCWETDAIELRHSSVSPTGAMVLTVKSYRKVGAAHYHLSTEQAYDLMKAIQFALDLDGGAA